MSKYLISAFTALALLMFLPCAAEAKTIIKEYQHFFTDTVWTAEAGPYIVEGFNWINTGTRLVIKPGTIIKMHNEGALYSNGELRIEGSAENPVIITSVLDDAVGGDDSPWSSASPVPGSWADLGVIRGGKLFIDHAVIKYGGIDYSWEGGFPSGVIFAWNGPVDIKNTIFTQNIRAIFNYGNNYTVTIHNSRIYNNQLGAVMGLASKVFDATDNWWGHDSGPYYAGYNPKGLGDAIETYAFSSAVKFDPWIGKVTNKTPVLSYLDSAGYGQDGISQGVEPDKGNASSTEFIFRIVYADQDNDAPKNISVIIQSGSASSSIMMGADNATDTAAVLHDRSYANGEQYIATSTFPQGKYRYHFIASDEKQAVRWPASGELEFEAGYSNIVFIPGIEASRLYKQGALLEDKLWEPNRKADVGELFLDDNGSSLDPDIYTRDVIDEVYGTIFMPNIYKTFLASLDEMVSESTINDYEPFPYDWRMGIDNIVSGVVKTDTGGYSMVQEVEDMASSSQTGRVTIVAHSMGGLVAKRLMQRLEADGKGGLIDKLILVASPQAGTPSAITALLHGDDQELGGGLILDKATARELGENMRSAYSLLPSTEYFQTADKPVIEFDTASALLNGWRNDFGDKITSYEDLKRFMSGQDGRIEPLADDTDTPNVLSLPMLSEAGNLHASIDAWTPPAGLEVIQIAGWGLDTISGIRYKERVIRKCPDNNYFSPQCIVETVYDREPVFSVEGDETVMINSSDFMNNEPEYYINLYQQNKVENPNGNHRNILEVKSIQQMLNNVFKNTLFDLPNCIYLKKSELSRDEVNWRVSIHSPVSVDLYDSKGRHTGLIANPNSDSDLAMIEKQIPNSYYLEFGEGKYAGVGDSAYTLDLKGTDYGTFTLDITKVQGSDETTLTYADIPVMPASKVKVKVDDENIGALEVDMNGDGQTDFEIGSPGESIDPIGYVDIIVESVKNMPMEKQMRNYLLVKLRVIKDKIGKDNVQAIKEVTELTESYIINKTGKFIGEGEARVLVDIIANLKNLIKT